MTVGQQLAPYVEEDTSTKEKEAVPCDFIRTYGMSRPAPPNTLVHEKEGWESVGHCLNEATHTGMCPMGDFSVNACEECMNAAISGVHPRGERLIHNTIDFCSHKLPYNQMVWFKR